MTKIRIKIVKNKDFREVRKLYKEFNVSKKADICLAIGGDGTFVRAAKEFSGPILPIRSNEAGSMGYYSDVSLADIDFIISNIKKKKFAVEKLENKIEISYRGKNYYAVNEALLHNILEEVSFRIYEIKAGRRYGIYPYVMSGDGMIITGAIGSTAYNKSAGGPIILIPNVICLTFLNVDGPYRNPIVIDSSKTIEIEIIKYRGVLRYDNSDIGQLKPGDTFRVRVSAKELKVLRFNDKKEALAQKLDRIIKNRMES